MATTGELIATVAGWVSSASTVTVLTGAGISTDSGIPDFRGPNGLWTKDPQAEKTATLQHYLADPEVRRRAWRNRLDSPAWTAQPNAGHRAIMALEEAGKLVAVVTQNVDGLHQAAGHGDGNVIEVHGTMRVARCWDCGDRRPMEAILARVRGGEDDPDCEVCGGVVKSDTISFGQALDADVIDAAMRAAERCDLLLAVGTMLSVFPAANLVPRAKAAGARVAIVNAEPTAMDRYADAVILGSIGEVLPRLVTTMAAAPPNPDQSSSI